MKHPAFIEINGGRYSAGCLCTWAGPWRRWRWLAVRDKRRHVSGAAKLRAFADYVATLGYKAGES